MKKNILWTMLFSLFAFQCFAQNPAQIQFFKASEEANGKVYGMAMIPAKFKTITKEEAPTNAIETKVIAPEYRTIKERVMMCPAFETDDMKYIEYDTFPKIYTQRPEDSAFTITPPEFDIVDEKRLSVPAYKTWKMPENFDAYLTKKSTPAPVWKQEDVAEKYSFRAKKILKTPQVITWTVEKAIIDTLMVVRPRDVNPNKGKKGYVPTNDVKVKAKYAFISKDKKLGYFTYKKLAPPRHRKKYSYQEIETPSTVGRVEVLPAKMYKGFIPRVKNVLKSKGYAIKSSKPKLDTETKKAIIQYQNKNGLPIGQLDIETLTHMGVLK